MEPKATVGNLRPSIGAITRFEALCYARECRGKPFAKKYGLQSESMSSILKPRTEEIQLKKKDRVEQLVQRTVGHMLALDHAKARTR